MNDQSGGESAIPAHVLYESKGPVAILRLNRPEKLNALTLAMHQRHLRSPLGVPPAMRTPGFC
jgi:hypothetical protein